MREEYLNLRSNTLTKYCDAGSGLIYRVDNRWSPFCDILPRYDVLLSGVVVLDRRPRSPVLALCLHW